MESWSVGKEKSKEQISVVRCQISGKDKSKDKDKSSGKLVGWKVGKERQKQMSDIRYQISGKTKAKKQKKQKRKELSNVFGFYTLLHLLTTDN